MTAPERFYPRGILRIAETVFRETAGRLTEMPRAVLALSGGSGAGKTTVAGLLAERFRQNGLKALVLAGDDFPRRVPSMNDAERLCRFRDAGTRAAKLCRARTCVCCCMPRRSRPK